MLDVVVKKFRLWLGEEQALRSSSVQGKAWYVFNLEKIGIEKCGKIWMSRRANVQHSTFSHWSSPRAPGPTGYGTGNSYGLRASTCYQDVRQGPAHSGLQPSEPRTRKYPQPRFGCPPIYMVAIPNRILTGSAHQAQCLQYPSRYPSI